jgi:hypothetical protein
MAIFQAGLCQMLAGILSPPYEGATIDTTDLADAIKKAKKWAATIDVREGSWLQILYGGKSLTSLKPGEF